VDGGHRAIKFSRIYGIMDKIYGEGTHFRIPWLERAIIYDVRARPRNVASLTGSKGTLGWKACGRLAGLDTTPDGAAAYLPPVLRRAIAGM